MNTPADLQRWSDDVARDPRSLAFLPLARAYRKQGLVEAAAQLCLRGLEHHPSNVEAHGLLALLYLEQGERQRAADEWSIVLRMDPDNFDALRGMGFCYLERDQLARARQMLERAAALRPSDSMVREALGLLGARPSAQEQRDEPVRRDDPLLRDDPWTREGAEPPRPWETADADTAEQGTGALFELVDEADDDGSSAADGPHTEAAAGAAAAGEAAAPAAVQSAGDPSRLFDELLESGPLLGALLVDATGLVHAGRLTAEARADASVIGAVLGGAVEEAARTAQHLSLGAWRGILLEAEHALLQLAPVRHDTVVVLAARRNAPTGWLMRAGTQAADRAARYLEAYA